MVTLQMETQKNKIDGNWMFDGKKGSVNCL